jgi:hypothetical protein
MAVTRKDDFEILRSSTRRPHDDGQAKNLRRLPFAGERNEVCGRPLLLLDTFSASSRHIDD